MKKFRSFLTVLFLLASLITILFLVIIDNSFFYVVTEVVRSQVWIAGIILLLFLGLFSAGIVSNLHSSDGSLISNGYFQLAILELFLVAVALVSLRYYIQQPGQIVLRLSPGETKEYINVGLTFQSAESAVMDTITAPGKLNNRPAGKYRIETLDPDVEYFQTDIILEPTETEILVIPVVLNSKSLAVQTDPTDAEIWIDGLHAANTPHTFEIANRDTIILELKMEGYQSHVDTINLNENMELATISLAKLFTLRISCAYSDIGYRIYDSESKIVFSGRGSRAVQLPMGKYKLAYEIGEGQFEYKSFLLNRNYRLNIQ